MASIQGILDSFTSLSIHINDKPVFVNPESRYLCPVCQDILYNAMQTSCGHRLCDHCVDHILSKQDPAHCPVGEDTCEDISRRNNSVCLFYMNFIDIKLKIQHW